MFFADALGSVILPLSEIVLQAKNDDEMYAVRRYKCRAEGQYCSEAEQKFSRKIANFGGEFVALRQKDEICKEFCKKCCKKSAVAIA